MRAGHRSLQATLRRCVSPPLWKAFLPQPFLPQTLRGKRQVLVRRCKTVSPHYINHPHKIVPKAHYRTSLCFPPPPLVPASGAPGDHRLPAVESVKPNGKQTSKSEHQSQMKICSCTERKVTVCKPGGSVAWLAPKGRWRRWCPRLAWCSGEEDEHLERTAGELKRCIQLNMKVRSCSPACKFCIIPVMCRAPGGPKCFPSCSQELEGCLM